jgi:hypothetical protein
MMPNLSLLHQTLLEIRKDREAAVNTYRDLHQTIEGTSISQQAIDQDVQIFEDRLTIGIEYPQIIELFEYHENMNGDPLERFKDFEDSQNRYGSSLKLQFHNIFTPGKTFLEWLSPWINNGANESTIDQRNCFSKILENLEWENKRIFPSGSSKFHLNEMKWSLIKCYGSILLNPLYEKSKKTYIGYIRKIDESITKSFHSLDKICSELTKDYPPQKGSRKNVTISLAAEFLRSLEDKALKSSARSPFPFTNLLLAWASILMPIPAKQLILLQAPDIENFRLQLDSTTIPLARSFIKFWKSFGEIEFMFPASIRAWKNPESYLNQIIKRQWKKLNFKVYSAST